MTRARLRRLWTVFLMAWVLGIVPVLAGWSPALKASGLGLWAPGAGFLYTADPLFAVLTVVLFGAAFAAWFATGNILAPPAVWLLASAMAAWRANHHGHWTWAEAAVPLAVLAGATAFVVTQQVLFRAARRRATTINRFLADRLPATPRPESTPPVTPELSADDLAAARFLLDLALQPIDRFDGFEWIDQFQTAAVRYQLCFAGLALSMLAYTRTPAFTGYLAEAQANLIAKTTDKRVWRYWRLENLWGNLRYNPDPIPRDNIMLSGYLGLMIGAFETVTGDGRFDQPGSLTFAWDDERRYPYEHTSIAAAVHHNFLASPFGMFPCEPNWIYAGCNTFGMNTLLAHDRLHSTSYGGEALPGFRHANEVEFLTADGRVTAIRSSRLGLTIPSLTSTMADAGSALFLHPSLPDVAERTWAVTRRELMHDEDGALRLSLRGWDKLDVGNYKLGTDVTPHAICAAAALEMGDSDACAALRAAADRKFEPTLHNGALRYAKASTLANGWYGFSRFGRPGGFRDLVTRGRPEAWVKGPVLAQAPYPDVLVARATTDGADLSLVLHPGSAAGRFTLGLDRLDPGRSYDVVGGHGSVVVANPDAQATFEVELDGRTEVRLVPRA